MAAPVRGQQRFEPYLGIALQAGVAGGSSALWAVGNQPLFVPNSGGQFNVALFDTVAVTRTLRRGITVGVGMTWHRTPRFSFGGRVEYTSRPGTQHCRGIVPWHPEPTDQFHPVDEQFNHQLCGSADGRDTRSGLATFTMFARYATGLSGPFASLGIGAAGVTGSMIETAGSVTSLDCPPPEPSCQALLYDSERPTLRPLLAPGLGIAIRTGKLAQLLIEARDVMTYLPRANYTPLTIAQTVTSSRLAHTLVLHAAMEFAFVAHHERRY